MKTIFSAILVAASVADVSAQFYDDCFSVKCPVPWSAYYELALWSANIVASVVHPRMAKTSKGGADAWLTSYRHGIYQYTHDYVGPESVQPEYPKWSAGGVWSKWSAGSATTWSYSPSPSSLGVSSETCEGLCTAADVACGEFACKDLPDFLQGPSEIAAEFLPYRTLGPLGACSGSCGSAITACKNACN